MEICGQRSRVWGFDRERRKRYNKHDPCWLADGHINDRLAAHPKSLPPRGQCHQLKETGPDFPVIANQSADWCGNPFPLQRPDFEHVTKEKTDCHVASLLAMTVVDGTPALKLMTLPSGEGA